MVCSRNRKISLATVQTAREKGHRRRLVKELNQTVQSSRAQEENVSLCCRVGSGRQMREFQIGERQSRRNV